MCGIDVPIKASVHAADPYAEIEQMRRSRAAESYRSVYLKREDFEKYGYTEGCYDCLAIKKNGHQSKHITTSAENE